VTYAFIDFPTCFHHVHRHRHISNHSEGREIVEKIKVLEWKPFFVGEVVEKNKREIDWSKIIKLTSITGATIALAINSDAALAAGVTPANFESSLASATQPIKDIIFGFAHEIYFVFMAWGAIEALIGKPQQGFTRMKIATASYVLLYWVPWIVETVNGVVPR
jgi:hypothetical protein